MPNHKFRIGQMVTYRPAERGQDAPPGACMITARLPESEETGEFEYRIRNLERQTHMNDDPVAGHVKNILPLQNYSLKSRAFTPPFAWLPNV
jgi:hypothetical protein